MGLSGEISDQFLSLQISEGREEAFDFIFRKYYRTLCAQAFVYLKDDDLAQSVVQDCFIVFWEKRSELDDIKNLHSYLSFMVRNRSIDHLRKKETERKAVQKVHESSVDETVENDVISYEFEGKFMEAVSKLPDRCRIAFEYSRLEGLKYQEIASKMSITTKAVEALMGRSLKILRSELSEYLPVTLLFLNFF